MKTQKAFIAASNIDATLIRAVVRQVGGWDSFKELAADVANHGADSGFSGFTYYTDTVKFTSKHKASILEYAGELASEIGDGNALSLISSFNCLKAYDAMEIAHGLYHPHSSTKTDVFNALAWFALEEVARSYSDLSE